MKIYLDNAATTPLAPEALEVMLPYFSEKYGNPSSIHQFGREAKVAIEKARKSIAQMLNVAPAEIFFTSGGTETANLVIQRAIDDLGVTRIVTSHLEHHCVLHTIESLFRRIKTEYVEPDAAGNIRYDHLEQLLAPRSEKTLVCLMHANNEIGNITDIHRVGELCKTFGAYFFSDTVQTIAHYPIDLQKINAHFISGSAHKFHGPKGAGFIYMRSDAMLKPMLHGGSQERNMRSGTENITGIIGMEKAMSMGYARLEEDKRHILSLKQALFQKLKATVPGISVNGNYETDSLYTVLNVSFPPTDKSDFLVYNFDMNGIAVSAGSACASGTDAGSHVLKALNAPARHGAVRFSFSRYNTREEIDAVAQSVRQLFAVH